MVQSFFVGGMAVLVYLTEGSGTILTAGQIMGLPVWRLEAGPGRRQRRRAAKLLRELAARGARRVVFDEALCRLAWSCGLEPVPVLPLRLALAEELADARWGVKTRSRAARLWCGSGGETAACRAADVLARRVRYVEAEGPCAGAVKERLYSRWGISAGRGGYPAELAVLTGEAPAVLPEGETLWLTEDCAARQQVTYRVPPALDGAGEPLLAALLDAGKCLPSEIHVASVVSLLDRRG